MRILSIRNLTLFATFLVMSAIAAPSTAVPIVEALNFSNGNGYMAENGSLVNYTVGWMFTVNSPIQVTSLGYFDGGGPGFNESHDVALYTSTGTPLISTTVATTDPLVTSTGSQAANGFRYHTIAPYFLGPGDYVIGGQIGANGEDDFWVNASSTSTPSAIAYTGGVYAEGAGLLFPSARTDRGLSYFGPNFQFEQNKGISVNFREENGAVGSNAAGVVPLNNWNDISNPAFVALPATPLKNSDGVPTTLSLAISPGPNVHFSAGVAFAQPGNTAMMTGHIYNGPAADTLDLSFTGAVPYDTFDLYLYYYSDGVLNKLQTFDVLNSANVSVVTPQVGNGTIGIGNTGFILSTGANNANYVLFTGLSSAALGSSFTIRSTHSTGNFSYFTGLQIVQTVPEPSSLVLAIGALASLAVIRRRGAK